MISNIDLKIYFRWKYHLGSLNLFDETEMANVAKKKLSKNKKNKQEKLLKRSINEELKVKFKKKLSNILAAGRNTQKISWLWEIAKNFLIAFPSSYRVEKRFSVVTNTLPKKRSELNSTERGDLR
ncbi:hypothetical protein EVAR_3124_1 [Eumeta japonica]|uniref:Uncharacterized protein n=1 Tax=Eumeta variegata TaxID=151549 RepID=A0A4C1XHE9_EUMVA|nr:hypothetical protein EVAR_3124_1 [Eumeta japonica]